MKFVIAEHAVERFIERFDRSASRATARETLESLAKDAVAIGPALSRGTIYRSKRMPTCDLIVAGDGCVTSVWFAPLGYHVTGMWSFRPSLFGALRPECDSNALRTIVNTASVTSRRLDGVLIARTVDDESCVLEIFADPREKVILSVEQRMQRVSSVARSLLRR